ncbi:hypothetical protein Tco_0602658, partial [Tanacetum coccineum]
MHQQVEAGPPRVPQHRMVLSTLGTQAQACMVPRQVKVGAKDR